MKKNETNIEEKAVQPKKSKKGLIILLIVIAVIMVILSIIAPFIFIFGLAFLFSGDTEYEQVNENVIKIPSYNITVEAIDADYDQKEECFILYTKVDKEKKSQNKVANFFDYGTSLEVTYKFKDKDGYVIGSESLYIEGMDKDNKWKQSVYYCDSYADSIYSYEVDSVNVY